MYLRLLRNCSFSEWSALHFKGNILVGIVDTQPQHNTHTVLENKSICHPTSTVLMLTNPSWGKKHVPTTLSANTQYQYYCLEL